jgi:hypothetical protein
MRAEIDLQGRPVFTGGQMSAVAPCKGWVEFNSDFSPRPADIRFTKEAGGLAAAFASEAEQSA